MKLSSNKNLPFVLIGMFILISVGIFVYIKKISVMKPSQNLIDFIKSKEGLSLQPYIDDNVHTRWTEYSIGYGHQIKDSETKLYDGITLQQANGLLVNDITYYSNIVSSLLKSNVSQGLYDAIVSLTYNIGGTNFANSTLLKVINTTPSNTEEIKTQFRRWNTSMGSYNKVLAQRRENEINMFA